MRVPFALVPDPGAEPVLAATAFRLFIGERELGFAEVRRLGSATDLAAPPKERRHHFETVVLRRALTGSTELYDWRMRRPRRSGRPARRDRRSAP